MRIADKMQYNQVSQNINRNRTEMADLQSQAATQKRINKPSDDPLSAARVLSQKTEERGNTQFLKNITQAKAFLEFSDQSLSELSDLLVRAKELAVGQSSDAGANAQTRRVTAAEIEQIFNQSVQIGNRKLGDRFIFSGYQTNTTPFSKTGEYQGDQGEIKIQTHKDSFVAMNIPGSKVFLGQGLGGDGVAHAVTDSPKTVDELNAYRAEEQQRAQDLNEMENNSIQTRGPASAFDSSRIGNKDPVTGSEGLNVFKALRDLEVSLKSDDKDGIQLSLDTLDQAINQVVLARAEVGSRVSTVNGTMDSLQKAVVDNKTVASQLEDADIFQVVSDISKTDSTLKATLETSGKMIQSSLLDFIK